MSTLSELGAYLDGQLTDVVAGVSLFQGTQPDSPDKLLVISQYPGGEPEYVQESFNPNIERVQIQVVVRGQTGNYDQADRICALAWKALASVRNVVLSGTRYRSIVAQGRGTLGVDSNNRPLVGFNATVEKETSYVV